MKKKELSKTRTFDELLDIKYGKTLEIDFET
jgi:hypothetical protein